VCGQAGALACSDGRTRGKAGRQAGVHTLRAGRVCRQAGALECSEGRMREEAGRRETWAPLLPPSQHCLRSRVHACITSRVVIDHNRAAALGLPQRPAACRAGWPCVLAQVLQEAVLHAGEQLPYAFHAVQAAARLPGRRRAEPARDGRQGADQPDPAGCGGAQAAGVERRAEVRAAAA